jgi:hypothetical protein
LINLTYFFMLKSGVSQIQARRNAKNGKTKDVNGTD